MNPDSPIDAIAAVVGALDSMGIPWFLSGVLGDVILSPESTRIG
jgi:hypothetical protein